MVDSSEKCTNGIFKAQISERFKNVYLSHMKTLKCQFSVGKIAITNLCN